MTGRIIITGISEAEKAAKEILEHIQAIKDIQRRMVWFAYLRAPLETCRMTGDAVSIRYSDCAGQQGRSRQRQLTASC